MNKNILMVLSVIMMVMGVILGLSHFSGNTLAFVQAFAAFTFSYAMGTQVQVIELREKIAKLRL